MIEDIKEAALDYINSERERNFYAANRTVTLQVFGQAVDVETVWYQKQEDKVYLHCGCKEFEGDIDVESLSDENQERLREVLACENVTDEDVPRLMQMHDGKPLVFLFRVTDVDREEVNRGLSREECFKRCAKFYTLDELGDAWNDTDDNMRCLMDVKRSWCYVSQPEPRADRLPKVSEPEEMEFYSIEPDGKGGKQIHMLGYIYQNDDHWTGVEPAFLILPLQEFIDQLAKEEDYTDRLLSEAKLYEGDYDDEGAVDYINHYFNGHTANRRLHYSEITIDTPCGDYIA